MMVLNAYAQTSALGVKLTFDKPATKWTEAIPLGNGRIFDHPLFKLISSPGGEETGVTHWLLDRTHLRPDRPAEQLIPARPTPLRE